MNIEEDTLNLIHLEELGKINFTDKIREYFTNEYIKPLHSLIIEMKITLFEIERENTLKRIFNNSSFIKIEYFVNTDANHEDWIIHNIIILVEDVINYLTINKIMYDVSVDGCLMIDKEYIDKFLNLIKRSLDKEIKPLVLTNILNSN